jgi:hypothetical protein
MPHFATHTGKNISLLWSWIHVLGAKVYKHCIPTGLS